MDIGNSVYPLSRYVHSSAPRHYHAYGNTPAHDFLQNYAGEKEPTILVLGCGDIRSYFYTIWKNFNPDIPARFDGVHFVFNDASAAVLARNILFLYLCLEMPEEESELKKWLSGMWAIWYCHELYPDHDKLLHDSLGALCKYSEDWFSSDNPLHSTVKFTSPATLSKVSAKWKMWLERDVAAASVKEMNASRSAGISGNYSCVDAFAFTIITSSTDIPLEKNNDLERFAAQKSEILAYVDTGNAYAENVLGLDSPIVQAFTNVTFYEKEDGAYSLHYSSIPYRCYYHTVDFSSDQLHAVSSTLLMVTDKYFKLLPLLANSFQQFSLWLQSSHKALDKSPNFSFTFDSSHNLTYCYELENSSEKFDIIDSPNVVAGMPNLILSCIPLLKSNGLLYTTARYNVHSFPTAEKYLASIFGFPCKLFPILLGLCCINHEGEGYSSPVIVLPCQVTSSKSDLPFREKRLLWNKVDSATLPQIFPPGQSLNDTIVNALLKSFEVSVTDLLTRHPSGMEHLNIETTMKLFQVFVYNTRADFDPLFWEPLSELLKEKAKPYLSSIQVHLFLHRVHMHLTVAERDCPMCLGKPLSNSIGLFSGNLALFDTKFKASSQFQLVAFVHKEECCDADFLRYIARKDGDVHIFDCTLPSFAEATLFYFYAPLELAQQQYKVTIISSAVDSKTSQLLCNFSVSFAEFKIFRALLSLERRYIIESFGEITSHVSDGDSTDTMIKTFISDIDMADKKLISQKLSSNTVRLSYGSYACKMVYPYVIAYKDIKIKASKKQHLIIVHCPRGFMEFNEEMPHYVISPDRELSLLSLTLSEDTVFSMRQLTKNERLDREAILASPLLKFKTLIPVFYKGKEDFLCCIHQMSLKLMGFVLIINRMFDCESKAPVIDLAYCFLDSSILRNFSLFRSSVPEQLQVTYSFGDEDLDCIKTAFSYFANRTNGTCDTASNGSSLLNLLKQHKLQHHFTRAVISPLICDPDKSETSQFFPLSRYWYSGDIRFYYAYGNTAAEDLLQHTTGVKNPAILLLGCGDIRSCFYTLWRHFDSSILKAAQQFDGVQFVLNDWSAAVLARNILFLYMCLQLPKGNQERKKWLSAMWAIWYCHELYPDHQKALDDSLAFLLEKSKSLKQWETAENPLHYLVQFTTPCTTLSNIAEIWNMWHEKKIGVSSVEQMKSLRSLELQKRLDLETSLESMALLFSSRITFIDGDTAEKTITRIPEVSAYFKNGNCYAEDVLNLKLRSLPTTVNLTLFERPNGVYSLHYGSIPYSGYYHTVEFSSTALASSGMTSELCDSLLVQNKAFKSHPLLANSVQQFTMWVQSSNEILNEEFGASISFSLSDKHAESFCQELTQAHACEGNSKGHSQFDLIHTSNLIDHLGPLNVILLTLPLLKQEGLLLTTTMMSKSFAETVEEFLSLCFGFDCLLLPVILGIRCINHEGTGYSSPVMIMPTPVDTVLSNRQDRLLLWKKVLAHPLVFPVLPAIESGNITDALLKAIKVSAYALLSNRRGGRTILNNSCIETAILLLKLFRSSVGVDSSYQFWGPLSQALTVGIKPFLCGFQTQALLNGLHIHLTVDESNCPICRGFPLEQSIGLFCAEVPLPLKCTPHFMVIIHKYESSDPQYLCSKAKSGEEVHIFDCIDGVVADKILKLRYFAPVKFWLQNYKVTIAICLIGNEENKLLSLQTVKVTVTRFVHYVFNEPNNSLHHDLTSVTTSFGKITTNICDGDSIKSEIVLHDSTVQALSSNELHTSKPSPNELELSCGSLCCSLKFKYPIDYTTKLSIAQKSLKIAISHQVHEFDNEDSIFIASPDHELSLPPQHISEKIMICHTGMQQSDYERITSTSPVSPLVNVKKTLMHLFQYNALFFYFASPENTKSGLVIVNKRFLDYQHRVPAIDLAFCFLDASNTKVVERAWNAITSAQTSRSILVDDSQKVLLKRVLLYFSKRTNGSCQSANNRFNILCQHKIDQHFRRAVVYLLYCDPDRRGRETQKATLPENPVSYEKCEYCRKCSSDTKKCAKCRKVFYCGKTCQVKHWPKHKLDCKKSPAPT